MHMNCTGTFKDRSFDDPLLNRTVSHPEVMDQQECCAYCETRQRKSQSDNLEEAKNPCGEVRDVQEVVQWVGKEPEHREREKKRKKLFFRCSQPYSLNMMGASEVFVDLVSIMCSVHHVLTYVSCIDAPSSPVVPFSRLPL